MMTVFAGDLTDFALPAVLRVLADNAKTGLLEVVTYDRPGGIELVEGRVRAASVDRWHAGLARRLLGARTLDASTLLSVLEAEGPLAGDHRLAEQLVRGGHLDAGEVVAALHEHTNDAVLQMVRAAEGSFHFRTYRIPEGAPAALSLSAAEVVEEVARRQRAIESLTSADLPLRAVLLIVPPPNDGPVTISARAWELLALVDGRRSVAALLEIAATGIEDTYRHLAELLDAGVATADPAAATRSFIADQQRLTDLERRWASELRSDSTGSPPSAEGSATARPADTAPPPVTLERTATITSLSSRDPQRHLETGPRVDERTLRRLIAGVEALP